MLKGTATLQRNLYLSHLRALSDFDVVLALGSCGTRELAGGLRRVVDDEPCKLLVGTSLENTHVELRDTLHDAGKRCNPIDVSDSSKRQHMRLLLVPRQPCNEEARW